MSLSCSKSSTYSSSWSKSPKPCNGLQNPTRSGLCPLSELTSYSPNSAPATGFLAVPQNSQAHCTSGLGSCCYSVWNVLLPDTHTACSLTCFKSLPKGELLSTASNRTITPLSPPHVSLLTFIPHPDLTPALNSV